MEVTKHYDEDSNLLLIRRTAQDGYWEERIYNQFKHLLTYEDSKGRYEIKGIVVSKEEFNEYINNK